MELPQHLKELYRHWPLHTKGNGAHTKVHPLLPNKLQWFIDERIKIWEQKTTGKAPPYTTDPALATFRFCNIFRELDRQTTEIHSLLNPLRDDFALWLLNMFYARLAARPETLHTVGLLSFDKSENKEFYTKLVHSPRPRYGTPYVFPVSTILRSATPTRELFIAHYLPQVMHGVAEEISTWQKMSVYDGIDKVLPLFKFDLPFLWTEVLIDVAYQYPHYLDLYARFPIGPGSRPTFATLARGDASQFVATLAQKGHTTSITYNGTPLTLSAENWEGIGCEYRKYSNLSMGHGRRRLYRPSGTPTLF